MENPKLSTTERWARIERIFHAALEQSMPQRAAWLDRQCARDAALRREVDRLLQADDDSEAFLRDPAFGTGFVAPTPEELGDAGNPTEIGPYRLTQRLGSGGMGTVWLAERRDEHFHKQVAVKLIKRGMDTPEILQRFRNERQVLAQLEHPNIARLIDGGATDDGRPYLVMERVEGVPLNIYCDQHQAGIRERLKLFLEVCEAVQYAHQNLVVHRDLKPSNILVTPQQRIKLLDFGIAKVLSPDPAFTSATTAADTRLMTARYASPEQVRGGRITTASDVYSLGVVLYELLTGCDPYELTDRSREGYERAIREQEPRKPSTAVSQSTVVVQQDGNEQTIQPETRGIARGSDPRRLRQQLGGDLDTIVLTALHKDAQRRYPSVEAFAEDIRRHLGNLPIAARPDAWSYRTAKFIRRNKAGVAALAVVVTTMAIASVVSATMYFRADAARGSEADQRAVAEQITQFVNGMLQAVDPRERGPDVTVQQLLDEAAERVEADLGDQPPVERGVRTSLGLAYFSLGLYDEAQPHLRRALGLDVQLWGEDHPETASSMTDLAHLLRRKGEYDEAASLFRGVLDIERRRFDANHERVADAMNNLGLLLYEWGKIAEAGELCREALRIDRAAGERSEQISSGLNNLAGQRYAEGDYVAAETLLREAHDLSRDALGPTHPHTVDHLNNLAGMLMMRGRYADAEKQFRETLALRIESHGADHPVVAVTINNLASSLRLQRRFREAEPLFRQALGIRRERLGDEHPAVATTINNLALTLSALGDDQQAVALHREALDIRVAKFGERHRHVAKSMSNLAHALNKLGEAGQAEALYREALAVRRETLGERHPGVANTLANLAGLLTDAQRYEEAETLAHEALAIQQETLGAEHPNTGHTLKLLGRLLTDLGRFADAEAMLTSAERALEATGDTQGVSEQFVKLYEAWEKPDQAAEWRAILSAYSEPPD